MAGLASLLALFLTVIFVANNVSCVDPDNYDEINQEDYSSFWGPPPCKVPFTKYRQWFCDDSIETAAARFDRLDSDDDERISRDEFYFFNDCDYYYIDSIFCSLDKNKDDFVSSLEYKLPSFSGTFDITATGKATPGKLYSYSEYIELVFGVYRPNGMYDQKFNMVDKDGDNYLSRDEFLTAYFPEEAFEQFDADKNGNLNPTEMDAYLASQGLAARMTPKHIKSYYYGSAITKYKLPDVLYKLPAFYTS